MGPHTILHIYTIHKRTGIALISARVKTLSVAINRSCTYLLAAHSLLRDKAISSDTCFGVLLMNTHLGIDI